MVLALYLIPEWNGAILDTLSFDHASTSGMSQGLLVTLWLAIPVMVFSFVLTYHLCFCCGKREEYGDNAEEKMFTHLSLCSYYDGDHCYVLRV